MLHTHKVVLEDQIVDSNYKKKQQEKKKSQESQESQESSGITHLLFPNLNMAVDYCETQLLQQLMEGSLAIESDALLSPSALTSFMSSSFSPLTSQSQEGHNLDSQDEGDNSDITSSDSKKMSKEGFTRILRTQSLRHQAKEDVSLTHILALILDEPQLERPDITSVVERHSTVRDAEVGDVIYDKFEAASEFYVILSGEVAIEGEAESLVLHAGAFFGFTEFNLGEYRYYTAEATEPTVLCVFTEEDMESIRRENGDLYNRILKALLKQSSMQIFNQAH